MRVNIGPAKRLNGLIRLPGDKSISHRAAMLSAIAQGTSSISNFATSADCNSTLACLEALGVKIEKSGTNVTITGRNKQLDPPFRALDCGNSGTTMRLLAGILAGQPFTSTLTGDESLSRRPMHRIIEPLTKMGASVESKDGRPPLIITGNEALNTIEYDPPVASAQVKSCILLASLFANGKTSVIERTATRDHTERMLKAFGVESRCFEIDGGRVITVCGRSALSAMNIDVPSDVSSAAFFLAAAACLEGSEIELPNVGLNPTRTAIIDVLTAAGASTEITDRREYCSEPVGTIRVRGGLQSADANSPLRIDGTMVPRLIDEIPVLAVLGTQLACGLEVHDAAELRVKESDRIKAIVHNLGQMMAKVEEFDDGFRVHRSDLKGNVIDSFGDHRIAMAFAVAGLLAEGETEIVGAECADVSFPGFFDALREVIE